MPSQIPSDINFLDFLGSQESQFFIPASSVTEETLERLHGDVTLSGDTMPWSKTHARFRYRPGEVTILGAYNGHKKSMILNQICAWNLRAKKWLIASLEMTTDRTMARMVRQISGEKQPEELQTRRIMKWTDNRLWLYDQTDTVDYERILGMVHYAGQVLGINHVIIDSLMKCGIKSKKEEVSVKEVEFVNRLCWAAKNYGIHIHLVHHMRKGEGNQSEYKRPGKHDFRGAGELVDLVDNALILHQNKWKAEKIEKGETLSDDEAKTPDATLQCVKQRNGEWEGAFNFWFDNDSLQHIPAKGMGAMPYKKP